MLYMNSVYFTKIMFELVFYVFTFERLVMLYMLNIINVPVS